MSSSPEEPKSAKGKPAEAKSGGKFTDLFIRRPVIAIVVNLVIIIAGLQAVKSLTVRQYPKSESASITVTTVYVGANADLVKGFITTPQGRIEVRWECRKDRYELRVAIPKNTTAEVLLPPEAKAVWQAASSTSAYQDTIPIHNSAVITVEPGRLDIQ